MKAIGAYEAKTHLAQLLDEVARGETVTITRHGVPVAVLAPPHGKGLPDSSAAIAALRAFRRGITLGGLSLREMIEQGRK
ncbi:MAG: type II toxin-antitoxin system prevent-host-death family antitoxin [Dehalococcoidia bacterium]|nr:type II toxin-antitoxin system prevent-host-death family antitoxin [Dehalococcoidia bacterium]